MAGQDQIELAHEASFKIAGLTVIPATRELVSTDGSREVIEPRVMQVMVVLASAGGATVSRDDLVRRCWENRAVGDDAINRVISRLRRVADGIGNKAFRIETVTKVGYRLITNEPIHQPGGTEPIELQKGTPIDRRVLMGGAAATIVLGGGALWQMTRATRPIRPAKSPQVTALFDQGLVALRLTSNAGNQQACGLFRRASELAPDDPDTWGALGYAQAIQSHTGPPEGVAAGEAQAGSAIARARSIDAANPWAEAAAGALLPRRGRWADRRVAFERAARGLPGNDVVLTQLSDVYASTGQMVKAAQALKPLFEGGMPSNFVPYHYGLWLWGAGRLIEADTVIDQGRALYPVSFALWFLRFFIFCHSGRAASALALAADEQGRPPEIPARDFDHVIRFARLMLSPNPALIDDFLGESVAMAHEGAGLAENTMQFAAALGRPDIAFAVAEALYFDRGFTVPALRFGGSRGNYSYMQDRRTYWLFLPSTLTMRRDPRFVALTRDLGLDGYWQSVNERPDDRD